MRSKDQQKKTKKSEKEVREIIYRNTDLKEWFYPGRYRFMMQIYTMEQAVPRVLDSKNRWYTGSIFLTTGEESFFELQYTQEDLRFQEKLWYYLPEAGWMEAQKGQTGERIPTACFEFARFPDEALIEGHILIAYTKGMEKPDSKKALQLEVEIWR